MILINTSQIRRKNLHKIDFKVEAAISLVQDSGAINCLAVGKERKEARRGRERNNDGYKGSGGGDRSH